MSSMQKHIYFNMYTYIRFINNKQNWVLTKVNKSENIYIFYRKISKYFKAGKISIIFIGLNFRKIQINECKYKHFTTLYNKPQRTLSHTAFILTCVFVPLPKQWNLIYKPVYCVGKMQRHNVVALMEL